MRARKPYWVAASSLACILLGACADSRTGIDISLYPDPNLNTLDQVLAQADALDVVLDAEGGLYFPGEEMDDGTIAIYDADGDPSDLELVARVDRPSSRLPRIRLERGGLPDVQVDVTVRGYDTTSGAAELVALGSLPVVFDDAHVAIAVPFNLLASKRPLRVDQVLPGPTQGCAAPRLTVVFSRPVIAASVLGPGVFSFEPGGPPRSVRIDSVSELGTIAFVDPPASVVTANGVHFRMTISTNVVDPYGDALDQFPIAGDQPYVGTYDAPCVF